MLGQPRTASGRRLGRRNVRLGAAVILGEPRRPARTLPRSPHRRPRAHFGSSSHVVAGISSHSSSARPAPPACLDSWQLAFKICCQGLPLPVCHSSDGHATFDAVSSSFSPCASPCMKQFSGVHWCRRLELHKVAVCIFVSKFRMGGAEHAQFSADLGKVACRHQTSPPQ